MATKKLASKVPLSEFEYLKAKANPKDICDARGVSPFSVSIFSGADYSAKIGVVWSKGSEVAIYSAHGNLVWGTSSRHSIYLKGKAPLYSGIYLSRDTLTGKVTKVPVTDLTWEEIVRIERFVAFQRWITGPVAA